MQPKSSSAPQAHLKMNVNCSVPHMRDDVWSASTLLYSVSYSLDFDCRLKRERNSMHTTDITITIMHTTFHLLTFRVLSDYPLDDNGAARAGKHNSDESPKSGSLPAYAGYIRRHHRPKRTPISKLSMTGCTPANIAPPLSEKDVEVVSQNGAKCSSRTSRYSMTPVPFTIHTVINPSVLLKPCPADFSQPARLASENQESASASY